MIRKNKKFIDPRYFMDEKMELSEQTQPIIKEELDQGLQETEKLDEGPHPGSDPRTTPLPDWEQALEIARFAYDSLGPDVPMRDDFGRIIAALSTQQLA
jgi:hypothetical protein